MRSLTVGIFGDPGFAGELGKKGTSSDITVYNRKEGDFVLTFVSPSSYPDKISSLLQAVAMSDVAVLCINKVDSFLGEAILALDCVGVEKGLLVLDGVGEESISPLIKDTCLRNYQIAEKSYAPIMEKLRALDLPQKEGAVKVLVDHCFEVKSVGTVALGTVKRGKLLNHASLQALPIKKDVLVRSIQMQDENVDEADCFSRVGLALKGASAEELYRGCMLAPNDSLSCAKSFGGSFEKSGYYKGDLSAGKQVQALVGLQFIQVNIENTGGKIALSAQNDVAFEKGERFVLADGGAKGLRIAGKGVLE